RNVGTFHDMVQGLSRGRNSVFILDVDGIKLVHLGDLGHLLSDDQIRQIGPVDVLLIPVGGVYTLNGTRAKEVVAQLKPRRTFVPIIRGAAPGKDVPRVPKFPDGQPNAQPTRGTNLIPIAPDSPLPKEPVVIVPGYGKK